MQLQTWSYIWAACWFRMASSAKILGRVKVHLVLIVVNGPSRRLQGAGKGKGEGQGRCVKLFGKWGFFH